MSFLKYTGCLKNAALKLLYGVQKHLVGEGKIFKKFLVFIFLHNGKNNRIKNIGK
jgi:hypothetical protein